MDGIPKENRPDDIDRQAVKKTGIQKVGGVKGMWRLEGCAGEKTRLRKCLKAKWLPSPRPGWSLALGLYFEFLYFSYGTFLSFLHACHAQPLSYGGRVRCLTT